MKCQQRTAKVKLVRIVDSEARSVHLCEQCAGEASPYVKQPISLQEAIEQVLSQLVQKQAAGLFSPEAGSEPGPRCSECGRTFREYERSFLLGCARCYKDFGGLLESHLRRLHGETRHVGRCSEPPRRRQPKRLAALRALERDLEKAVAAEDFETAARLRDRIRDSKGELDHVHPEMPEM